MLALKTNEVYEHKARIIKAMAHPSRLMIIDALADGERCVCELREIVGSDISTVSKHLSVMRAAGIVSSRKDGLQVYYRLQVPCILGFFGCVDAVIREESNRRLLVSEAVGANVESR